MFLSNFLSSVKVFFVRSQNFISIISSVRVLPHLRSCFRLSVFFLSREHHLHVDVFLKRSKFPSFWIQGHHVRDVLVFSSFSRKVSWRIFVKPMLRNRIFHYRFKKWYRKRDRPTNDDFVDVDQQYNDLWLEIFLFTFILGLVVFYFLDHPVAQNSNSWKCHKIFRNFFCIDLTKSFFLKCCNITILINLMFLTKILYLKKKHSYGDRRHVWVYTKANHYSQQRINTVWSQT